MKAYRSLFQHKCIVFSGRVVLVKMHKTTVLEQGAVVALPAEVLAFIACSSPLSMADRASLAETCKDMLAKLDNAYVWPLPGSLFASCVCAALGSARLRRVQLSMLKVASVPTVLDGPLFVHYDGEFRMPYYGQSLVECNNPACYVKETDLNCILYVEKGKLMAVSAPSSPSVDWKHLTTVDLADPQSLKKCGKMTDPVKLGPFVLGEKGVLRCSPSTGWLKSTEIYRAVADLKHNGAQDILKRMHEVSQADKHAKHSVPRCFMREGMPIAAISSTGKRLSMEVYERSYKIPHVPVLSRFFYGQHKHLMKATASFIKDHGLEGEHEEFIRYVGGYEEFMNVQRRYNAHIRGSQIKTT